jgi:hypothetical protein
MALRSGIGRPIDPSYPSNVFVVAAAFAAGAVGSVVAFAGGSGILDSLGWGVAAGGAAFVAWAVGREVDPDRTLVAGAAAPVAAAFVAVGRPSLVASGAVMLAARVAARTTGWPVGPVDLVVLAGLAGWSTAVPAGVPAGIVLGAVLVTEPARSGATPPHVPAAGAAILAGVVAAAAWRGTLVPDPSAIGGWQWVVLAVCAVGVLAALRPARTTTTADNTGEPLDPARLTVARVVTAMAVGGALVWAGGPGLVALAPAGTGLAALVLPPLWRQPRLRSSAT